MVRGDSPLGKLHQLTARQARERLLAIGQISAEEADAYIDLYVDPQFVWMENIIVAVWGRKPTV